jgi:hypothetical protein
MQLTARFMMYMSEVINQLHGVGGKEISLFYEPENSLQCTKQPANEPYPEPAKSSPRPIILFL